MKMTEQKNIKKYNAVVYKAFCDLMFILCMKTYRTQGRPWRLTKQSDEIGL